MREAFPVEPVPLASALVEHNPACEEAVALRESLAGKRWDALEDAWLNLHDAELTLLTGTALRYYLPAFLLRAWREPRWPGLGYLKSNLDERLDPLAAAQRAVLRVFVEHRCSHARSAPGAPIGAQSSRGAAAGPPRRPDPRPSSDAEANDLTSRDR